MLNKAHIGSSRRRCVDLKDISCQTNSLFTATFGPLPPHLRKIYCIWSLLLLSWEDVGKKGQTPKFSESFFVRKMHRSGLTKSLGWGWGLNLVVVVDLAVASRPCASPANEECSSQLFFFSTPRFESSESARSVVVALLVRNLRGIRGPLRLCPTQTKPSCWWACAPDSLLYSGGASHFSRATLKICPTVRRVTNIGPLPSSQKN